MVTDRLALMLAAGIFAAVVAVAQPPSSAPAAPPASAPAPLIPAPTLAPAAEPPTASAPAGPYWLRVASEEVNLRSRADRNSPVVARVPRDAALRAASSEFGWHRVLPPEGVFSYVAKKYIERKGDDVGVVTLTSGNLRVRVGSLLTVLDPDQSDLQSLLPNGTPVRILGEQGEWYKIVPPEGVFLYVAGENVERVSDEVGARLRSGMKPLVSLAAPPSAAPATQPAAASQPAVVEADDEQRLRGLVAATRPAEPVDLSGQWGKRLVAVEAMIETESNRPPLQRDWENLIALLKPISAQRQDPAVARIAEAWIARLRQRIADREMLLAAQDVFRGQARDRAQFDLEMEQLRKARDNPAGRAEYDARGTLLRSYVLRGPGEETYKLRNPITGGTEAYIEFDKTSGLSAGPWLGHYIAVVGPKHRDAALGADVIRVQKVINLERPAAPASQPAAP